MASCVPTVSPAVERSLACIPVYSTQDTVDATRVSHMDAAVNDGAVANRLSPGHPYFMFQRQRLCTRKPVFTSRQPRSVLLKVSAAAPPDRPSQRDKRPCPSSFRRPAGTLPSSGDSTRHQTDCTRHSLHPTACCHHTTSLRIPTTNPLPPLRTCILLFDHARRPSNTQHHSH